MDLQTFKENAAYISAYVCCQKDIQLRLKGSDVFINVILIGKENVIKVMN